MKKGIAMLLALVLLLGLFGCAAKPAETPDPAETPAEHDGAALAEAVYPALPEQPVWDDYQAQISEIYENETDPDKQAEEADKVWAAYDAAEGAYREALRTLRGESADTDGFHAFTAQAAGALLAADGENRVFSPANLYLALSMLTELTAGETQAQILALLGGDADTQAARCRRIWENLYLDGENSKTLLANSVWLNEGFAHHDAPLETLAEQYYASAYQVPMGTAEADQALRDWLNRNTGNLLEESVNNLETNELTALMLASTLYFKGAWRDEFQAAQTAEDVFTAADGSEIRTQFMHSVQEQNVIDGDGWTAASLAFTEQGSMSFLLPDEGVSLDSLLADGGALQTVLGDGAEPTYAEVHWSVPKFDVTSTLQLRDALQALGVVDAFDPDAADFTPLAEPNADAPLYVSSVEHAARVKVDEQGCEAAAYTVISVEAAAAEPEALEVVEMNLNRPFLFVITGLDGLPLFIGAVNTPQ